MKSEFLLRLKSVLLLPLFFLLFTAMSMVGTAQNVTIATDKDDYWPGEWVMISGTGWLPDEMVQLTLIHVEPNIPDHTHDDVWEVQADSNGKFFMEEFFFVEDKELNTAFELTALGLSSGWRAITTFTDAISLSPFTIGTQSGTLSAGVAGSATYSMGIKVSGSNNPISITISISSLPLGVTYTPSSVSYGNGSYTFNLVVTTTVSAPSGTFSFTVTASNPNATSETVTGSLLIGSCTPPATPTISAGSATTFCTGGSVVLTSSATTGSNQWYKDGALITGATNQTYTATTAGSYTVIVTVNCPSATSAATVVTINNITAGVIAKGAVQPGPGCGTLDPGITAVTTAATGSASPTYIWQQSTNGGSTWTTIPSETSAQINPTSFTVTTSFKRIATSTLNSVACSAESNVLEYVVYPLPTVAAITSGTTTTNVCVGSTVQLSNSTLGGVWGTTTPTLASVSATGLVAGILEGTATVTYTVTNEFGCSKTANKTVNVLAQPNVPTAVDLTTTYDGTLKTGSATVGTGETVDWYTEATNGTLTTAPSGTNAGSYTAWAEARNTTTGCKSTTRTQVTVTIGKASTTTVVTINGAPFTYTGLAQTPATVSVTGANLSLTPTANYTNNVNAGTANASYTYAESANHFGSIDSKNFTIGKADQTITWADPADIVYGTALGATQLNATVSVPGVEAHGALTYTPAAGVKLDAGEDQALLVEVAGSSNYNPASKTVHIDVDKKPITVTAVAATKVYDALTTSVGVPTYLPDLVCDDTPGFIQTYDNKSAVPGKTLAPSGIVNDGNGGNNYAYTFVSVNTGEITIKPLVGSITADNKVYDGNTTATILTRTLATVITGDVVNYVGGTAHFDNANVGTGKTVTATGLSLSGLDAANYTVNSTATTTANITQASTTTTLTLSAASVRYMDNITMSAVIKPLNTATPLTGSVEFRIGTFVFGTATVVPIPGTTDGSVQAMLIKQLPASILNSTTHYTVTATFTSTNTNYSGSTDTKLLLVKERSATYLGTGFYSGDVFVWTPTATSSTGTVALVATIKDENTPTGDVRGAKVTFYYLNNGVYSAIPSATNLPVGLVDMTDGTVGTASAIIQLNIGNQNAASYTIAVGISGAYINKKTEPTAIATITVSKPVPGGYVVVGGSLLNSASSGMIKGAAGVETQFSSDVQFNNKMTNPQGKSYVTFWSYYKPDGTLDGILHKYEISSNAIAVFAVGQTKTKQDATFSSKANLVEVLENGTKVGIESGSTLQLTMWDGGNGGTSDKFAITMQRKAGGVWFSSNWDGTKTIDQLIHTGNVSVSTAGFSTSNSTTALKSAEIATAVAPIVPVIEPSLNVYPNPFKDKLFFDLSWNKDAQARLEVYDVRGAKIATVFDGPINANENYRLEFVPKHVVAGMLIYRLFIDGQVFNGKVVYNQQK